MKEISKEFVHLDNFLRELLPEKRITSTDFIKDMLDGKWVMEPGFMFRYIKDIVFGYGDELKKMFVSILVLIVLSSLIYAASSSLNNKGIGKMSRLFFTICELAVLISSLNQVMDIAVGAMDKLLEILKISIPAYMICIGATGAGLSATVFYKLFIGFICLIEGLVISSVVPAVQGYMILGIVESIFEEERFMGIMEIIKKGIVYLLNGLIFVLSTSGILQLAITPTIDKANVTVAKKTASLIPVIGDIAGGLSEAISVSAVTLKNSIGVIILVLVVLCLAAPSVKILGILLVLKIGAAIGAITGEKQMISCVEYMTDAGFLLLRMLITVGGLFFISLAALTALTGA